MIKRYLLVTFFSIRALLCTAQTTSFPNVIPPSPETAALFSFLDYPVDLSTGQVKVSVPIYSLSCGSLTVPISISYNGCGRHVFDETGPVGLGWSLMAGGEIARTIYGKPDDQYPFIPTAKLADTLSNQEDYNYLGSIFYNDDTFGGNYDSEYDIFSYFFGNKSGRFVIDRSEGDGKTAYTVPLSPVKIESSTFPSYIVDEDGTIYNFTQQEKYDAIGPPYGQPITGKLLTTIISTDKKDTITFKYKSFQKISRKPTQDIVLIDDADSYTNDPNPCQQINGSSSQVVNNDNFYTYYVQRLIEIDCRNQKVLFNLDGTSDRINNIEILDGTGNIKKRIDLKMSVIDVPINGSTESCYSLDTLIFRDAVGNSSFNYAFEYYQSVNFATSNRDFYGFLNGISQTNLIPSYDNIQIIAGNGPERYSTSETVGLNANRSSNIYMQHSVLKKITYPTGGSTSFTYDLNLYKRGTDVYNGGGLRISQMEIDDGAGNIKYKTYRYGTNESGYGGLPLDHIIMNHMSSESRYFIDDPTMSTAGYRKRDYSSEIFSEISPLANEPVYYPEVTEYEGTPSNNTGKQVYSYTYAPAGISFKYELDYYPLPPLHSIPWSPTKPDFTKLAVDANLQHPFIRKYDLYRSDYLINLTTYKNNGDNTYSPVKGIGYSYNEQVTKVLKGLHVYKYSYLSDCPGAPSLYLREQDAAIALNLPIFLFENYDFDIGKIELQEVTETDYLNSGNVTKTTDYTYDNLLKTSETQTASNGDQITTNYRYPFNYNVGSAPTDAIAKGIKNLQDLNVVDAIIEEYTKRHPNGGSTQETISATLRTYKPSIPLPDVTYIWESALPSTSFNPTNITGTSVVKDANYKGNLSVDSYSNYDNVLQQHKLNDAIHSYIWDYNESYPVAEAVNASQADIAYTSFEADGKGNWSFNGVAKEDAGAVTGNKAYPITSGSISRLSLSSAQKYNLSYWSKDGSIAVSGGTQSNSFTGETIDGWTYHSLQFTGSQSVTISGSGYIDELRLYPQGAQMTTYTYEPLIGMTSQCDANNTVTYYTYDALDRLAWIRDAHQNILKEYCYNYSGQSGDCQYYSNTAISGTYTCHCGGDSTGSQVTYTVPAGKYWSMVSQSDATAQANSDLQLNGQHYADTHGTCSGPVSLHYYNYTAYTVYLNLQLNGQNHYYTVNPNSSGTLGNIPGGYYTVTASSSSSIACEVGCGDNNSGSGTSITLTDIQISQTCNWIYIDPN